MKNDFDRGHLQNWYLYNYKCWWCGRNSWNCFHHVLGRVSNSILNSAPLCNETCHLNIHGKIRKTENVRILLDKTLKYLLSQGYVFNDNDKKFIEKNQKYYVEILNNKKIENVRS